MRILVVDDNTLIVDLIKDIFNKIENVEIDGAYNTEIALKKLHSNKYDVYIIDYEIPHFNGVELSKKIKKIDPSAKIIIITANSDFKCEDFPVVYKPFDVNKIYELVLK